MSPSRAKITVDPRIERSRQVILGAALEELGDVGYGAFTIESVARRAGVGKATIYRHWSHKLVLIADAFKMLQEERDPELISGSPREA
jgi:TetR/AcrR family transcriptional regulator, regulator of autoinduction and epiphytic fitness